MVLLRRREAELAGWALPASRLYTGWQHRYMMNGVDALRHKFGFATCSVKIISAGYGLVDEEQSLVPYDATFQGKPSKWIHDRAQCLGIPTALRKALHGFDAVLFLLGKEYLLATHPPVPPSTKQRLVFLTSNCQMRFHSSSIIVPAGRDQTRFGAGAVALKGKMFELFALGLARHPDSWGRLLADKTPGTVVSLIEAGYRGTPGTANT
ncbi:MAG: hypothetical protein ACLQNE_38635 [Thermoguttaceae bacterium]